MNRELWNYRTELLTNKNPIEISKMSASKQAGNKQTATVQTQDNETGVKSLKPPKATSRGVFWWHFAKLPDFRLSRVLKTRRPNTSSTFYFVAFLLVGFDDSQEIRRWISWRILSWQVGIEWRFEYFNARANESTWEYHRKGYVLRRYHHVAWGIAWEINWSACLEIAQSLPRLDNLLTKVPRPMDLSSENTKTEGSLDESLMAPDGMIYPGRWFGRNCDLLEQISHLLLEKNLTFPIIPSSQSTRKKQTNFFYRGHPIANTSLNTFHKCLDRTHCGGTLQCLHTPFQIPA